MNTRLKNAETLRESKSYNLKDGEKGITLIALIVTIIVLLILAMVSVNLILRDNLILKAQSAKEEYELAAQKEAIALNEFETEVNKHIPSKNNGGEGDDNLEGNEPGITEVIHSGTIPEGAVYTTASGDIYNAGENFPATVQDGDIYTYEDYEYRYNYSYNYSWVKNSNIASLTGITLSNGWGVRVLDTTKSSYKEIINSINGTQIVSMCSTFFNCTSMENAPSIPETVEMMSSTFNACSSLKKAPVIPSGVTNISYAFASNIELAGEVVINANPTIVTDCFNNTQKSITITGSASDETKAALARTATNGNVNY